MEHESNTTPTATPVASLPSIGSLLSESWDLLRARFWSLLGAHLVLMLIFLVILIACGLILAIPFIVGLAVELPVLLSATIAVGIILGIAVLSWLMALYMVAMYRLIDRGDALSIRDAIMSARNGAWVLIPTMVWYLLIIIGGFTVLIIPGIILSFFLSFVGLVMALENKTGWDAFIASRELFRGRAWAIVWRMIAFQVIACGITVILDGFQGSGVAYLILGPLGLVYSYVLYKHLKQAVTPPATSSKVPYQIFGVIGGLVVAAGLVILFSLGGKIEKGLMEFDKHKMKKGMMMNSRMEGRYQYESGRQFDIMHPGQY